MLWNACFEKFFDTFFFLFPVCSFVIYRQRRTKILRQMWNFWNENIYKNKLCSIKLQRLVAIPSYFQHWSLYLSALRKCTFFEERSNEADHVTSSFSLSGSIKYLDLKNLCGNITSETVAFRYQKWWFLARVVVQFSVKIPRTKDLLFQNYGQSISKEDWAKRK